MALNNIGLGMTITATNLASRTLRRVGADVQRTSATTTAAGFAMRAGFATAAVGAVSLVSGLATLRGAMNLANQAGEFQQSIAAIGAVANATTEELEALRNAAIQAGIETQFSPVEATEGLQSLITAGQTATQATQTLIPVLDLAAGSLGQLGVAGAAEAVVGTLNSYQISADQAGNVTDRLLRITQLTNFQARDFSAGLAKAASAGAVFGQDLNDVLITMGLLRNANIDASSSSTAFRESVRRLGSDQRSQNAITQQGIDIFDEQTGEMRSVVDIMGELSAATADMGDEERNRIAATAFGARGLLAFNSVAQATFTTMRDGEEVTLRGAEAIEALRNEMDSATNTAEEMREQLLDTFAGQKQLLQGTLQTLGIVLGESFARIFKPIVETIVDTLNGVLQFFNELPDPVKDVLSQFVLFAGSGLVLFGVFTLIAGIIVILLPFLKALIITMLIMSTILLPLTLLFIGAGAAIAAFVMAARENVGGFGDFLGETWEKIKLGFRGLVQLFSQGGFSGAVREELNKAENQGLKRFLITVFRVGSRVVEFFRGVGAGFAAVLERMGPAFERLKAAFGELGEAFGLLSDGLGDSLGPLTESGEAGARTGNLLGRMFERIVAGTTLVVRGFAGFVRGFKAAMEFFAPVFEELSAAFSRLGLAMTAFEGDSASNFDNAAGSANTFAENFGAAFGTMVAFVADGITTLVNFITFMVNFGRALNREIQMIDLFFSELAIKVVSAWMDIVDGIKNALDLITIAIGDAASVVPESLRTPQIQALVDRGQQAEQTFGARTREIQLRQVARSNALSRVDARRAEIDAEARARREADDRLVAGVTEALERRRAEERRQQLQVNVQVDGETIARATADGAREDTARGFGSAPSETGS